MITVHSGWSIFLGFLVIAAFFLRRVVVRLCLHDGHRREIRVRLDGSTGANSEADMQLARAVRRASCMFRSPGACWSRVETAD